MNKRSRIVSIFLILLGFQHSKIQSAVVVNDITTLNPISVSQVVVPSSVEELTRLVTTHKGPISIGGGRYSQGGQTATDGALFIDMRRLNRIVRLDVPRKEITVQAGSTWRHIQEAIDPKGLSLKIMQTYSNFTVGGSLSVNVHGRYVGEGPLIRCVKSIKIMLADGTLHIASPHQNAELFYGAIGGYGGIGVIVEATFDLATNEAIERTTKSMPVSAYQSYFIKEIKGSKVAVFHNADLYPPAYKNVRAVTWSLTHKPVTTKDRLAPINKLSGIEQLFLSWVTKGHFGKAVRESLYDPYAYAKKVIEWRNYEASYDVAGLEPPSRDKLTYVLQEYFIPVEHFDRFVPKLRRIFQKHRVNVLNVSIRQALPDPGSLLAWAPREVFSFVVYYAQGVTPLDRKAVSLWTKELIDAALSEGGSYYLPYQIIATPKQFAQAYPGHQTFFALKTRVDPNYKFRNKLWDRYYTPFVEKNRD
ncbi:MAG: FAD-binding oxidoreductase [Alphaproteobacteria bacterium]|nr:FAD-binding oxidoreductase [Alphaproteobacteria bacterium]